MNTSEKAVKYRLAVRQLSKTTGLGKREIYIIAIAKVIEETLRSAFTPYHLLPLRGRVTQSYIYEGLQILNTGGYLVTKQKGKKFTPGQHSYYHISPKGDDLLNQLIKLYGSSY